LWDIAADATLILCVRFGVRITALAEHDRAIAIGLCYAVIYLVVTAQSE